MNLIKYVSSNQIYNLPLFETYLVIDCRRESDYNHQHIASALNYPPCESSTIEEQSKSLEDFANYASTSYINELWSPIILYGTNEEDSLVTSHISQFCEQLKGYISLRLDSTSPIDKKQRKSGLFYNISEKTKEIWILEGGYEDFQRQYPVLCIPSQPNDAVGGMSMIPLPFHISCLGHGVFVGSRAVKWTTELFRIFQIDCMLLDVETFDKYSTSLTECVIETMITSLPDHPSNNQTYSSSSSQQWPTTQLYQFLDRSTQYIEDCIQQSKRIVIQLHGRSHSAMVIIAWFMRFYFHMSFEDSYLELKKYLPKISSSQTTVLDENFLFINELKQWCPGQGGVGLLENTSENQQIQQEKQSNILTIQQPYSSSSSSSSCS